MPVDYQNTIGPSQPNMNYMQSMSYRQFDNGDMNANNQPPWDQDKHVSERVLLLIIIPLVEI